MVPGRLYKEDTHHGTREAMKEAYIPGYTTREAMKEAYTRVYTLKYTPVRSIYQVIHPEVHPWYTLWYTPVTPWEAYWAMYTLWYTPCGILGYVHPVVYPILLRFEVNSAQSYPHSP